MAVEEALGDGSRLYQKKKTNNSSWVFGLFGVALQSKKGVFTGG